MSGRGCATSETAQYEVSVNVTNTGQVAGAEVAQLASCLRPVHLVRELIGSQYMTFPPDQVDQPPKHLRGYVKAYLRPGETRTLSMQLVSRG